MASTTAALLAAGAIIVVAAATTTVVAQAAPAPFACDAFGYLFQSQGSTGQEVDRIDLANGQPSGAGHIDDLVNAVGYNPLDNFFYAYDQTLSAIVRIDSSWTTTPVATPPMANINIGDFDPATGHFWISGAGQWAEIDLAPGSPTYGTTLDSGPLNDVGLIGLSGGADWSFIGGQLYRVMQLNDPNDPAGNQPHLVRFNPNNHTETDLGYLGFSVTGPIGATFVDSAGNLYASDNKTGAIWRIKVQQWINNPAANPPFRVSTGPQSDGNDGARCALAAIPTLAVTKQVAGRSNASDQFTVALTSAGTTLDSATTSGTQASASTTDVPVTQGASFTITDAMAAGSPDSLAVYTPSISCQDTEGGAAPPVSGSAPTWTVTVTNATAYSCTVTNTPLQADLAITKTGPATIDASGAITWNLAVTNNGPSNSPGATVTDTVPAGVTNVASSTPGCAVAGNTVTCVMGAQANGGPPQQITVTGNAPSDYSDCDITNVASIHGQLVEPPNSTGPNSAQWNTCTNGPQLDVTKTAQTADGTTNAPPGTRVTYTITVTNPGPGVYTAGSPATFTDDLSGVLDDATVDANSLSATEGTPSISGNTLSWSGVPGINAPVQITYSVTVANPDTGDHDLGNAINSINGQDCPPATNCPPVTHDYVPLLDVIKTAQTADGTTNAPAGTKVSYTITVHNGGSGDWTGTTPAAFTDDLSGVLDDATVDAGTLLAGAGTASISGNTLSWSGPLAANLTTTITYSVTVNNPDTGDHDLLNAINSINGQDCPPATNCPPPTNTNVPDLQVTKTADTTNAPPGTPVGYTIIVVNNGRGDWTGTTPAAFTDDLSGVLDDATYNNDATNGATVSGSMLSWSGPLAAQGTLVITYSVTVNNPDAGDHDLLNAINSINGQDCPPATNCPPPTNTNVPDLLVTKTATRTDTAPGSQVSYTITVTNNGTGDWTDAAPASMTDDMTNVLDDADYGNDVTVAGTSVQPIYSAPNLTWSGPLAAGKSIKIMYSVTIHNPDTGDHDVRNPVTTNAGNCLPSSADTTCFAAPQVADLHILKQASTADAAPGSAVTYTLTVTNSGTGAWTTDEPASFTDDLSGVLDDATFDGTTAVSASTQGATVPDASYSTPTISWSGPLAAGDSFTLKYSVTIANPDSGDHDLSNAVFGVTGNCVSGSGDPACTTATLIPDLAIAKTSSSTNAAPGSTVDYKIIVTNSGTGDWTDALPASLSDDLSQVLDDAVFNNDVATTGATVPAPTYTAPTISWTGPLAAGRSFVITYSVTVDNPDTGGDHLLNNGVVTPYGPCVDPVNPDCQAPQTTIPDLAVTKTSSSTNATPGSTVDYTITVTNSGTGDWTDAVPASLSDDLSQVLDDAVFNNDVATTGATVPAPTYAEPVLSWSGALAASDSFSITYSVTVDNPDTGGDHLLNNGVVTPYGPCVDPVNPDCQAPQTTIPDLAVTKTSSSTNAAPGSAVAYTITVTNSGTGDWTDAVPASLSDDLSQLLDDTTYNADASASATTTGATVPAPTYAEPVLSWSGALAASDSFSITYSVTVDNPDTGGDHLLNNGVVTPYGPCVDPVNPDCQAPQTTIPDLAVTKTSSSADAAPGSTVDYTIMVSNSGTGDWTDALPASLSDDLSQVLDDATYNGDVATTGATVSALTYTEPVLSWSGPLVAGATFTVTYSVTINNPDTGDHTLLNGVVTPAGPCVDPTNPDCAVTTLVPDLHVVKTASATSIGLNGQLTYTLKITNSGTGDWTDQLPATATDDLSDVLDDASYNKDATTSAGTAAVTDNTLTWTGPLAAGDTVTVTYSVTVNDRDAGNHLLNNHVSTLTGNCDPEPTNLDCNTTTPVASYVITKTSDPKSGTAVQGGQTVTYKIVAVNTGQVDLNPTITDDLAKVLDDATYNDDAKSSAGTVTRVQETLTWTVPLAIEGTATLTYSVTVSDDGHGNHDLANVVTGTGPLAACGGGQSICQTHNPIPDPALAFTGVTQLPAELIIALGLLLLGGALLLIGRRRHRGAQVADRG